MFISKFESINGVLNEEQVEEWAAGFFHTLLTVMNSFFTHVDVGEAVERMAAIPFDRFVREELEGETEKAIEIAVQKVSELLEMELDFMRSYAEAQA